MIMEHLTHIFTCYCIVFCLYMCFRWTTKSLPDSLVKISMFLMALLGILIELKKYNII